jgi:hypothetical protein
MLRHAQHERILLNHFNIHSVRPETVEGLRWVFQQPVKIRPSLNFAPGTLNPLRYVLARHCRAPVVEFDKVIIKRGDAPLFDGRMTMAVSVQQH